jgi:putative ABC transport system ATP-binding protein
MHPRPEITIRTRDLGHTFGEGEAARKVLHGVEIDIHAGELVILMGPSGSGKTTLLTLIGCLRGIQEGSAEIMGQELNGASQQLRASMRKRLGFIFQAHNLHSSLTAIQNVRMGLEVHGRDPMRNWREACERVLDLVGLEDKHHSHPANLSGGQKQRVAIARALVGNPDIVLADEPTAALDQKTGREAVALLRRLADARGTTILMVTHDHRIQDFADRIVEMEDGRVVGA